MVTQYYGACFEVENQFFEQQKLGGERRGKREGLNIGNIS